jgi:hypothetical protein
MRLLRTVNILAMALNLLLGVAILTTREEEDLLRESDYIVLCTMLGIGFMANLVAAVWADRIYFWDNYHVDGIM